MSMQLIITIVGTFAVLMFSIGTDRREARLRITKQRLGRGALDDNFPLPPV